MSTGGAVFPRAVGRLSASVNPTVGGDTGHAMLDLQCTAIHPRPRNSGDIGRCQLLAGHEGPHAVMFCRAGRRIIRSWRDSDPTTIRDQCVAHPNLPWVMGMPRPAWGETA